MFCKSVPTGFDEDVTSWLNTYWPTAKVTPNVCPSASLTESASRLLTLSQPLLFSLCNIINLHKGTQRNILKAESPEHRKVTRQIFFLDKRCVWPKNAKSLKEKASWSWAADTCAHHRACRMVFWRSLRQLAGPCFFFRGTTQLTWSFSVPAAGGLCSLRASLSFAIRLAQV